MAKLNYFCSDSYVYCVWAWGESYAYIYIHKSIGFPTHQYTHQSYKLAIFLLLELLPHALGRGKMPGDTDIDRNTSLLG